MVRVEGLAGLENAIDDVEQFAHGCAKDAHLFEPSRVWWTDR
jgi:hypothetical protein